MTLKTKNAPIIMGFVILVYVGFAVANGLSLKYVEDVSFTEEGVTLKNPILTMALHIAAIVLVYILPVGIKHRIIFLRWRNPLPGCRVFTVLCRHDDRIVIDDLIKEYGQLPTAPDKQNSLWYKIYKSKQEDVVVRSSHGRWLLFRDLFSIGIILSVPSILYTFWFASTRTAILFAISYLTLLAALWICARNTGTRFTCNVLAR